MDVKNSELQMWRKIVGMSTLKLFARVQILANVPVVYVKKKGNRSPSDVFSVNGSIVFNESMTRPVIPSSKDCSTFAKQSKISEIVNTFHGRCSL